MARVSVGSGMWFDPETSVRFDEATRFDGSNHISIATGTQWNHERLYRTRFGRYILHNWSQWQGSREHYEVVSSTRAHAWLVDNGHESPDLASREL